MTNEGGESFSLGRFDQSHPPAEWDGRALTGRGTNFTLVYHIRPWTGQGGAGNVPVDPDIPAPYGLRRVRDVNDCVAHVPAAALLACALANYTDHPPLVWEGDGIPEQIDGYRIYLNRTPVGGTFVPIADWQKDARLWPGPSQIPCGETWRYAVAAYDLNVESQKSEFIALSGEECDNLALVEVELLDLTTGNLDDGVECDSDPITGLPLPIGCTVDTTLETYGRVEFWLGGQNGFQWGTLHELRLAHPSSPVKIRSGARFAWENFLLCHSVGGSGCLGGGRNQNKMVFLVREGDGMDGIFDLYDADSWVSLDTGSGPNGDDDWCLGYVALPTMSLDEWAQFDQTLEVNSNNGWGDCTVRARVRGLGRVGGSRVLPPGGGGPALSGKSANLSARYSAQPSRQRAPHDLQRRTEHANRGHGNARIKWRAYPAVKADRRERFGSIKNVCR